MTLIDSPQNKFENIGSDNNKPEEVLTVTQADIQSIGTHTLYRNRFNYGVNLGSLFVLESWIYGSLFDEVGGANSEFDAISKLAAKVGTGNAGAQLSQHYNDYINKLDWNWLKNTAKATVLRVPIGYWHVNNGAFLDGLPFAPLQGVYQAAAPWNTLKNLINSAKANNIAILIDIHGLPGGANSDAHSGMINNPASFFSNGSYVNKMVDQIIPFIVNDVCTPNENIAGLQIVNETYFDSSADNIKSYYARALQAITQIDSGIPVIISDGWWPQQFADWVSQNNFQNNIIIDSHVYRCFSDEDKSKDAYQIINELPNTVNYPKNQADFLVGEFSCVLDGQTWDKTQGDRNTIVNQFGNAQTNQFANVASWGWIFWTLQFQWGDGGEWGFVPMMNNGNLRRRSTNTGIDQNRVSGIIAEHINYWNGKGSYFEHWRYEDAIRQAVSDIQEFLNFDNSRLGRWNCWIRQRRAQYISQKGDSSFMWEWDQGYQRGLDEFNKY